MSRNINLAGEFLRGVAVSRCWHTCHRCGKPIIGMEEQYDIVAFCRFCSKKLVKEDKIG
jgi:hypothetical protein